MLNRAASLEYSGTVNSFIESEVLTLLKPAEPPRLKSKQSSAAFAICLRVCQKERKRGNTCCSHEAQIQYSQSPMQARSAPLFCIRSYNYNVTGFPHARSAVSHNK